MQEPKAVPPNNDESESSDDNAITPYLEVQVSKAIAIIPSKEEQESKAIPFIKEEREPLEGEIKNYEKDLTQSEKETSGHDSDKESSDTEEDNIGKKDDSSPEDADAESEPETRVATPKVPAKASVKKEDSSLHKDSVFMEDNNNEKPAFNGNVATPTPGSGRMSVENS